MLSGIHYYICISINGFLSGKAMPIVITTGKSVGSHAVAASLRVKPAGPVANRPSE